MGKQENRKALEQQLSHLLQKAQAHLTFEKAVEGINPANYGKKIPELPYTLWQLVEHIRIAQEDILDFSRNSDYKERSWPDSYWPESPEPASQKEWEASIRKIIADREDFIQLMLDAENLYTPFPHGQGQNLLREALLMADHTAYHTGQIVMLRRLLGDYEP